MAIRMMINKEKYEKLFLTAPDTVEHSVYTQGTDKFDHYYETTAVGCVLDTYERNGYNDSDFYATFYNPVTDTIDSVEYATTRGWCGGNYAKEDATPEVTEKALAVALRNRIEAWHKANERQKYSLAKGREVVVVKGRKVPVGTRGKVVDIQHNSYAVTDRYNKSQFGSKCYNHHVSIMTADGQLLRTYQENVSIADPESNLLPVPEFTLQSVKGSNWRSLTEGLMWSLIGENHSMVFGYGDWQKAYPAEEVDLEAV